MEASEAQRLKALDEENRKLKKLLAEAMLDVSTLREALGETSGAWRPENSRQLGDRGEGLRAATRLRADRHGTIDVSLRIDPPGRCRRESAIAGSGGRTPAARLPTAARSGSAQGRQAELQKAVSALPRGEADREASRRSQANC
jgi:hypothetical protein